MMKTRLIVAVLLLFSMQTVNAQQKKYKVRGEVSGIKSGKIRIVYSGPGAKDFYRDSINIEGGKFLYEGKMEAPHLVFFDFDLPQEERRKRKYGFQLFLDGTSINVKIDQENLSEPKITGSPTNSSYQEIMKKTNLFRRFREVGLKSSKAWKERNEADIAAAVAERDMVTDSIANYLFSTKDASKNYAVAYLVNGHLREMEDQKLEKVLHKFSPELQKSPYIKVISDDLSREKKIKTGSVAPLFSMSDTAGRVWTNADFKGKYLLIDFGASWCGWCKLEKPYLLKAYEKFKGDQFELVNISMDKNRKSWIADIEKEAYPWMSISDLKAFEGSIAKDYNLRGIPEIILIDPQGKILAKGLRGDNISKTIGEYLK